jgi:hypothetical protein
LCHSSLLPLDSLCNSLAAARCKGGGEKIEDRVREEMTNGCSFEQQQNNLLSLIADASESS